MKIIDLKINSKLKQNLLNEGYENLTEIQEQTIDLILEDKNIFGLAQTGSGKTAAFLVPIINKIASNRDIKALILAPTRDLADQIHENAIKYAKFLGIRTTKLVGKANYNLQVKFLQDNPHLIIGTPGRVIDLEKRGDLDLSVVDYLVLDEADQMLDLGFINDMKYIANKTTERKQTSLFSATASEPIKKIVHQFMNDFQFVQVKNKFDIKDAIDQKIYIVSFNNKLKLLLDILGDSRRTNDQCIIFTRTKSEADEISRFLRTKKLSVDALHSDRSQPSRSRILKNFKNNELQYLVATNVAARGIDISSLPLVINFDIPEQKETYVHRIGRTARAGKTGEAITFCLPKQKYEIKELERIVKTKIKVIEEQKYLLKDENAPVLNTRRQQNNKHHHNNIKRNQNNKKPNRYNKNHH